MSLDIGRTERKSRFVVRALKSLLPAFALLLGSPFVGSGLHAAVESPETGIELTSEAPIEYDDRTGQMVARQNARLSYDGWLLVADEIRYSQTGGRAEASGHVVIMKENYRLLADKVEYWPKEKRAELTRFRLGQPPGYVAGDRAGGTVDDLTTENPVIFYGEPATLAPRATADALHYFGDRRIKADRLVVRLGNVPVFFAPGVSGDIDFGEPYLEGYAGYSSYLGAFAGFGMTVGLGSGLDVGGFLGYFSERGILWGPILRYRPGNDGNGAAGVFRFNTIHDTGERGTDVLGDPIDTDRYFLAWEHYQDVNDRLSLTALVNAWSDSEVTRDFRPSLFDQSQQPDTYVEAAYRGSNYQVSLFGRYQANEFFAMTERLPEVRFDLMPTAIGHGFVHELQLSAARLEYTDVSDQTRLQSDRFDAYYGLSRAMRLQPWMTFTPLVGGRATHYEKTVDGSDSYTRWLGEIGFDASIKSFADFDFKEPIWEINGLRHLINTTLQYRYIPDAEKGRSIIPVIDRNVFSTALPPLSLSEIRPTLDDLSDTNTLRIGFDNTIQTRSRDYGSRDLFRLYLAGDIRFNDDPAVDDPSSIYTLFDFTPAPWLRARFYTRINPDTWELDELNTELALIDQEYWQLSVGTDFLKGEFQQYTMDGRFRVNETFAINARLHYDAKTSILNEASIRIAQNIHNLWEIEYGITFYDGPRRETGNRLEFGIRFLGF
ncbi:MAG: LPS assembly protein LptD [Opitutaceae bacterium]